MAPHGIPTTYAGGVAPHRSPPRVSFPMPPRCSRCSSGKARRAPWRMRWTRSRCTDVLRKRRSDGKRATAHRYLIRPAQPADLEDVREIERVVFSDPWSANDFAQCLEAGVPFLVAEQQGTVGGYLVAHAAADEGEILNLGVAPAHRRRGVGRALVQRALTLLAARGARAVFL